MVCRRPELAARRSFRPIVRHTTGGGGLSRICLCLVALSDQTAS